MIINLFKYKSSQYAIIRKYTFIDDIIWSIISFFLLFYLPVTLALPANLFLYIVFAILGAVATIIVYILYKNQLINDEEFSVFYFFLSICFFIIFVSLGFALNIPLSDKDKVIAKLSINLNSFLDKINNFSIDSNFDQSLIDNSNILKKKINDLSQIRNQQVVHYNSIATESISKNDVKSNSQSLYNEFIKVTSEYKDIKNIYLVLLQNYNKNISSIVDGINNIQNYQNNIQNIINSNFLGRISVSSLNALLSNNKDQLNAFFGDMYELSIFYLQKFFLNNVNISNIINTNQFIYFENQESISTNESNSSRINLYFKNNGYENIFFKYFYQILTRNTENFINFLPIIVNDEIVFDQELKYSNNFTMIPIGNIFLKIQNNNKKIILTNDKNSFYMVFDKNSKLLLIKQNKKYTCILPGKTYILPNVLYDLRLQKNITFNNDGTITSLDISQNNQILNLNDSNFDFASYCGVSTTNEKVNFDLSSGGILIKFNSELPSDTINNVFILNINKEFIIIAINSNGCNIQKFNISGMLVSTTVLFNMLFSNTI